MQDNRIKRVRLVPITGASEPIEAEVREDMPIGEAIVRAFPEAGNERLVIHDDQSRPIPPSTPAKEVNTVQFMPYTTGAC